MNTKGVVMSTANNQNSAETALLNNFIDIKKDLKDYLDKSLSNNGNIKVIFSIKDKNVSEHYKEHPTWKYWIGLEKEDISLENLGLRNKEINKYREKLKSFLSRLDEQIYTDRCPNIFFSEYDGSGAAEPGFEWIIDCIPDKAMLSQKSKSTIFNPICIENEKDIKKFYQRVIRSVLDKIDNIDNLLVHCNNCKYGIGTNQKKFSGCLFLKDLSIKIFSTFAESLKNDKELKNKIEKAIKFNFRNNGNIKFTFDLDQNTLETPQQIAIFRYFIRILDYFTIFGTHTHLIANALIIGGYHILTFFILFDHSYEVDKERNKKETNKTKNVYWKTLIDLFKRSKKLNQLRLGDAEKLSGLLGGIESLIKLRWADCVNSYLSEIAVSNVQDNIEDILKEAISNILRIRKNDIKIGRKPKKSKEWTSYKISKKDRQFKFNKTIFVKKRLLRNKKKQDSTNQPDLILQGMLASLCRFYYYTILPKRNEMVKAAVAEIINRNYAHHIGAHVSQRATFDKILQRIGKDVNSLNEYEIATIAQMINILNVYKDDRNEYIANLNNEPIYQSSYLYNDILLPFIENALLMDNIAANEGIEYKAANEEQEIGRGKIDLKKSLNRLVVRLFIQKLLCTYPNKNIIINEKETKAYSQIPNGYIELKAIYQVKTSNGTENYNSLTLPYFRQIKNIGDVFYSNRTLTCNDILISLSGSLGKHALYSILENFIRNTAKHSYKTDSRSGKPIEIIIRVSHKDENYYLIELTDNISNVTANKLKKLSSMIKETNIIEKKYLGFADMKINACLLEGLKLTDDNMKKSLDVEKDEQGHLVYQFSLLKHKEIAIIGHDSDKKFEDRNAGIYYFSEFEEYVNCQVKNFRFALVDCQTVDLSLLINSLHQLPLRLLLLNYSSNNKCDIVKLRKGVCVAENIFNADSKEKFLENCWNNWLSHFSENNLDIRVFFEQNENEKQTSDWKKAIGTICNSSDLKINATVCHLVMENNSRRIEPSEEFNNMEKYYILYDRHAKLSEKLKVPLLRKNFYEQIDKNSSDFSLLFNARTDQNPFLFIYELAEAGLIKILILDERVCEVSTEKIDVAAGHYNEIVKKGFRTVGLNCENKITRFDACWAMGIYVGTHIGGPNGGPFQPLKGRIDHKCKCYHYLKVKFQYDVNSGLIQLKGTTNFAQWDTNDVDMKPTEEKDQKDIDLNVDIMVIHRTKLKDLHDSWEKGDFLELLNIPRVIITTGGGAVDFIDTKKWKVIPTNAIRDFILGSSPAKLCLLKRILA